MAALSPTSRLSDTPQMGKTLELGAPEWGLDHHEVRVLQALAAGGGANAAARILCKSIKTVQHRITCIHKKMNEASTIRCVLMAERAGLLEGVQ